MRRRVLRSVTWNLVLAVVVGIFAGWGVGRTSEALFVTAIIVFVVLAAGAINYFFAARRDKRRG